MSLFQGIKFFIQQEIAPDIQESLSRSIASQGGEINTKPPKEGYVLVDPSSPEAESLLQRCFRRERWVVPFTYVETCIREGVQLKPIFVEDGAPMGIHIHDSIANPKFRETLCRRIMHSAGNPYAPIDVARVILADPKTDVFNALVKLYHLTPSKYIESLDWVERCVERQNVLFTPHVFKNPGGRRAGEERTQFTEDDEQKLCEWIAAKIPYKSTGGRTGNKLYQQLCEMKSHENYGWVNRHTWQSWRERYKKNAERLDKIIDAIVSQTKPNPGEKWQYGYVRQSEEKPKRKRKRPAKDSPAEPQLEEFVVGSSGVGEAMAPNEHQVTIAQAMPLEDLAGLLQLHPSNASIPQPHGGPAGDEGSSEWRIKIGNDGPPTWAKRKAEEDFDEEQDSKRAKPDDSTAVSDDTLQLAVAVAGHVIDQGLASIARETRFTVAEVREYYDRCGDMERTNRRFHRMREHLALLPDDD